MFYVVLYGVLVLPEIGSYAQVFQDGKVREHPAALRHQHYAALNYIVGSGVGDVLALVADGSGGGVDDAHYGPQRGGFARAVRAYEGDYLPLFHVEGNSLQGLYAAVVYFKIAYFKQATHLHPPPGKRL